MPPFKETLYAAAGYNTIYYGSGRPEFNPSKPMPEMESYLAETALGTLKQMGAPQIEEGLIGSFMAARFINQANLPGFLPFMIPGLKGKPCTAIEGACGTGGRLLATGIRSLLSGLADTVFLAGFEIQNTMKAVYGADVLAGAACYQRERKLGDAFFFPGLFGRRATAYGERYGHAELRRAMACWYEQAILNARQDPKAQEYYNKRSNLMELGMGAPKPEAFVESLNLYDCSKVSDGASSIVLLTEKGRQRCGICREDCVEIVGLGEAQGDITAPPSDLTCFDTTALAVKKALEQAQIDLKELGWLEVHDCFSISALLSLEAIGLASPGQATAYLLDGKTRPDGALPTNLSGGLIGFGHPTGASGVRQMVDLLQQLTGKAAHQIASKKGYGMMVSMGGNDKTVTSLIVKKVGMV